VLPGRVATDRIRFLDEAKAGREGRSVEDVAAERLLDEVVAASVEQERLENWIMSEVENGAALPGLYPPNEANRARYDAANVASGAVSKTGG